MSAIVIPSAGIHPSCPTSTAQGEEPLSISLTQGPPAYGEDGAAQGEPQARQRK